MNEENSISVRGTVERVTFRNTENGYTVLKINEEGSKEQISVVGNHLNAESGEKILITGKYITHPKFGKQIEAKSVQHIEPDTAMGIEKLLASSGVKGIGPQTAKKIVTKYGLETINVIKENPEKIASIPGVGNSKAKVLSKFFSEKSARIEVERYFYNKNFTPSLIDKIYTKYGQKAVDIIKLDPYKLCYEIEGVGFLTADKFAKEFGFTHDSSERIAAGLFYTLKMSLRDGNCYLPTEILIKKTRYLLGLDVSVSLEEGLNNLRSTNLIVENNDKFYLKALYIAEDSVANFIGAKISEESSQQISETQFTEIIIKSEKELGICLSSKQKECLILASKLKFLVITGGPGCGKTTVIRTLVNFFSSLNTQIALTAPTGKAAQRMSQVCGTPAQTIHRLLKYNPHLKRFEYGASKPLKLDETKNAYVDVVIVDESSMIDIELAKSLFSAIPKHAKIILVGDKDQLPSVGPGRMFADLVELQSIPKVVLDKIFRRNEESIINEVAKNINTGVIPSLPKPDGAVKSDIYFLERDDTEEISQLVEKLFCDQLPRKFGFSIDDIKILTPTNKGPLGTLQLNTRIQKKLTTNNPGLKYGNETFRVGDRVSQRKNNYNIHPDGVFNGDTGKIIYIDEGIQSLTIEFWDGRIIEYKKKDLEQISLAYAISIHRSQGSEIPCVIMLLHDRSHFILLERQLLYTGLTRAKQMLVIIGTKKAIAMATKKTSQRLRFSNLSEKVSIFTDSL